MFNRKNFLLCEVLAAAAAAALVWLGLLSFARWLASLLS